MNTYNYYSMEREASLKSNEYLFQTITTYVKTNWSQIMDDMEIHSDTADAFQDVFSFLRNEIPDDRIRNYMFAYLFGSLTYMYRNIYHGTTFSFEYDIDHIGPFVVSHGSIHLADLIQSDMCNVYDPPFPQSKLLGDFIAQYILIHLSTLPSIDGLFSIIDIHF